ncbi:hypothetical protein [Paenibacillus zanthoxyli]|uniref:hypothetical protein n=1 Tax=Paenibacillus zanthoxyli TaxID=369399 RepID=UPI0012EBEAB2|nr:hypothetical protein [Paenibacillus zanthoxyli]
MATAAAVAGAPTSAATAAIAACPITGTTQAKQDAHHRQAVQTAHAQHAAVSCSSPTRFIFSMIFTSFQESRSRDRSFNNSKHISKKAIDWPIVPEWKIRGLEKQNSLNFLFIFNK